MDASSARRMLTRVFLAAAAVLSAVGLLLYFWGPSPGPAGAVIPYEGYLLYVQHYDWVNAPFLRAFRAASICAVLVGLSQLLPRAVRSRSVWLPGAVLVIAVQVAIFNIVVNVMNGAGWLYDIYLVMSWFEPWLPSTLGNVGSAVYSTGGVTFISLLVSVVALYAVRRNKGALAAIIESLLFLSTALVLFEISIAEYKPFWWNLQVTDFQFSLGLSWLTNDALYSIAISTTAALALLRVVSWRVRKSNSPRGWEA